MLVLSVTVRRAVLEVGKVEAVETAERAGKVEPVGKVGTRVVWLAELQRVTIQDTLEMIHDRPGESCPPAESRSRPHMLRLWTEKK